MSRESERHLRELHIERIARDLTRAGKQGLGPYPFCVDEAIMQFKRETQPFAGVQPDGVETPLFAAAIILPGQRRRRASTPLRRSVLSQAGASSDALFSVAEQSAGQIILIAFPVSITAQVTVGFEGNAVKDHFPGKANGNKL